MTNTGWRIHFGCSRGNSRDVLTLACILRCCFADLGDFAVLLGEDGGDGFVLVGVVFLGYGR